MRRDLARTEQRSTTFSEWLAVNFDLDNFECAVITRKAEEVFLSTHKKAVASVADDLLAMLHRSA